VCRGGGKEGRAIKPELSSEKTEEFIRRYYALGKRCFMCERIAKKIEQKQPLSDGELYHMRVCLPALEKTGKQGSPV